MADHFYSLVAAGQAFERKLTNIVVGTTSTGANPLELRVTDTAVTREQLYAFLEWLSDLAATSGDASSPFNGNTPFTG